MCRSLTTNFTINPATHLNQCVVASSNDATFMQRAFRQWCSKRRVLHEGALNLFCHLKMLSVFTRFSSFPKLWQIWHFLTWVSNLTAYFCCISRCSLKLLKRRRSLSSRNTLDLFLQTLFFGYNHHIHVGLNTKNFFPLHKYVVYHQLCSSAERKDSHSSRHVFLIWMKIRQKLSQVSSLWITQNLYAKINEKNNLE